MSERILIVGPAWVGDMVMAQSLFIALKQRLPDAELDVLAPGWSLPILARMPEVRSAIEMPLTHGQLGLGVRWRLGRQLKAAGYTQAIVLPRSLKAALVPWFAGIPVRTGYRGEMRYGIINDRRPLDKSVLTQTVQRFVALGLPRGQANLTAPPPIIPPRMVAKPDDNPELLPGLNLDWHADRPVLGLMPGAEYGPAKQWPATHYGALAKNWVAAGGEVWIFGSGKEADLGAEITEIGGGKSVHNLCGKTQLEDVVDLLSLCAAVVTNDSGLMHIAGAVDVPVVALYGSSSPAFTPPLAPRHQVIRLGLDCSPCFERTCRFGHYNCLTDIEVGRVLTAAKEMLPEPTLLS